MNKISFVLILMIIGYLIIKEVTGTKSKVGVIQMEKLVYEFQGMKDATKDYQKRLGKWNMHADSLEQQLKNVYQEIQLDSISGNKIKLVADQQKFHYLQKTYYDYNEKTTEKAKEEDQEMTIGILNQLKEYMGDYAEENGYDLIISNTQMQNVGYTTIQNDVTEQVLEFSNRKYSGD